MKAYKGNKPYIFISYAHNDSDTVLPILEALSEAGFRIWYDAGIQVGTEWPEYTAAKLSDSNCVIAFISKAALASQNCRREINFAIAENKVMISVYLEEVNLTKGMKMQLGIAQGVYYHRMPFDTFLENLLDADILIPCCGDAESTHAPTPSPLTDFEIEDGILKNYIGDAEKVVIPDCVTSIGDSAFEDCESLVEIVIPNSVTSIGDYAFCNCKSLVEIVIPNSVTSISHGAFWGCENLVEIVIPNSVTSIGDSALKYCKSLAEIVIPNSVTSIGDEAFWGCESLAEIVIPNSVASIGDKAFAWCDSLSAITVARGNSVYYSQGNCIIEKATNTLVVGCQASVIPYGITSVGDNAFRGCENLVEIVIPNSVTSIGDSAFSGCESLAEITVARGNSVYYSQGNCIIEKATNTLVVGCQASVIPYGITSIGDSAFEDCENLVEIVIPNSVTSIGDYAFCNCKSLVEIVIPNSVTSIGGWAFWGCANLVEIVIPNSVTSIGNYAFWGCANLVEIVIPDSVTSIGDWAFEDCKCLAEIVIPNSVTSIGDDAFWGCENLVEIVIPNSVTSISHGAFRGCRSLAEIVIPNSVTSIGDSAFWGCYSLTIYCKAKSKPDGWHEDWNPYNRPVVWGYKG